METTQQTALREPATAHPLPLPFDDGADDAIPFVLTAAAHVEVLGRDAPPLMAVVASPHEDGDVTVTDPEDEPVDTRRAQSRALLRSGMPLPTIAAALGVTEARIEEWTSDLRDELARRRRRRPRAAAQRTSETVVARPATPVDDAALVPGLAFALAEVDDAGVSLVHDALEPVAILLAAIRSHGDVPSGRIRVAARVAPGQAADRLRATIAQRLDVDAANVIMGRSGPEAMRSLELRVDVRDEGAARLV